MEYKLLAIDGPAILRRVYEASAEEDGPAKAELAVRHALSSFKKILQFHQPSHAIVAFEFASLQAEAGGTVENWRQALHPAYQHSPMPDFLQQQLANFCQQLQNLGLAIVSVSQVEVMDMLATAVMRWLQEGRGAAVICSNHRLLHSLLAHGALLWDHFKQEFHDPAWVQNKYGVTPDLIPALLALVGDAAEGVPGVPKIGMKTAAKLLTSYGDLDAVLAGAGILPDKIGQNLRAARSQLETSRQLMQLKTDVVLGVSWKRLQFLG